MTTLDSTHHPTPASSAHSEASRLAECGLAIEKGIGWRDNVGCCKWRWMDCRIGTVVAAGNRMTVDLAGTMNDMPKDLATVERNLDRP